MVSRLQLEAEAKLEEEQAAAQAAAVADAPADEASSVADAVAVVATGADSLGSSSVCEEDGEGTCAADPAAVAAAVSAVDAVEQQQQAVLVAAPEAQGRAVVGATGGSACSSMVRPVGRFNRPSWWPCCQVWPDNTHGPAPAPGNPPHSCEDQAAPATSATAPVAAAVAEPHALAAPMSH